jgi:hypothetical protein
MARSHGRIMAAIWNDGDFIACRASAQRLFMFLLSQPDLSHAGLLPMRVNRWAKKAEDTTPASIRDDLDYLSERRFLVVDEDTEEVLIRSFVRNDGVYKQPKVMIRMREDAQQIESPLLRAAFRAELDRLPLDELNAQPGGPNRDLPSTREQVERVVSTLRIDFADAPEYPSEGVSDTPRVRARAFHLPPTTVPQPPTTVPQTSVSSDKSDHTEPPERFDEFWEAYGNKVGRKKSEVAYRNALKKPGVTPDLLIAAAAQYVAWCRETDTFIKNPLTWLHGEHWTDERVARQPLSNVQQHLALARRLAEEEQGQTIPFPQIGGAR